MSIETAALTRVFKYGSLTLPDPGSEMSPMAVRNFYASAGYSELASAAVVGPAIVGTTATYEIQRTVRDKG